MESKNVDDSATEQSRCKNSLFLITTGRCKGDNHGRVLSKIRQSLSKNLWNKCHNS